MRKLLVPICVFSFMAGCSTEHYDTFRASLVHMCEFHRLTIIQTLLTPEQQRAGQIVCGAVGMGLGS